MNLANRITIARILVIPVLMVFLLLRIPDYGEWIAAVLFVLAAATDAVDGYIARTTDQVTVIGKLLDPLADKLLVSAALIALVELRTLSAWIAMIIISREFAVSGLRMVAVAEGRVIAASVWGKAKTTVQIIAVTAWILVPRLGAMPGIGEVYYWAAVATMGAAVLVTLASGVDYFVKARDVLVVSEP